MHGNGDFKNMQVDGYRYYYRIYKNPGSRLTPVFIFNGFLQNMNSWKKYISYFTDDSDVIIADLPGAGNADTIAEGEFNLDRMGYYVNQIFEKEKLERIDIISASYGAGIAYGFAKNYPEKVNHLMAAGAISELDEDIRRVIMQSVDLVRKGNMKLFSELIINLLLNEQKKKSINKYYIIKKLLGNQFRNLSANDRKKYIVNCQNLLNHPVLNVSLFGKINKLLVTGEFDNFARPQSGRILAHQLSNCIFTTIKNADHLFHLEQTDTALKLIKSFFRDEPLESVFGVNSIEYF